MVPVNIPEEPWKLHTDSWYQAGVSAPLPPPKCALVASVSRELLCGVRLQRLQAITCGQGLSSSSLRRVHTTPNTMTNLVLPTPPGPSECLICSELALLVLFCPCQHSVACEGGWRHANTEVYPPNVSFLEKAGLPGISAHVAVSSDEGWNVAGIRLFFIWK